MGTSGQIILLNGTSSAGKSALARALQDTLPGYPIHTGIDHIHENAPSRLHVDSDGIDPAEAEGFLWVSPNGDGVVSEIRLGPAGLRLWAGMHAAAVALASTGNTVIVDDLLFDPRVFEDAVRTFFAHDALFVGVRCPIDVAEQRERERERTPGLARACSGVHDLAIYDLEIDTSVTTPRQGADLIRARLLQDAQPTALRQLHDATR